MEAKKKYNKGMTNQIQRWHVMSTETLASWLPERKHSKYPGTNRGNCIAWIGLGSQTDEWMMTFGQKTLGCSEIASVRLRKDMYGDKMMGPEYDDGAKEEPRAEDSFEPAFYHHLPETLYTDVLGAYEVRGVLDLTPGAGDLAKACLLRRMPYMGLGMTEQHCQLLKGQLVEFIKMQMRSEGSTFYSPDCAAASAKEDAKKGAVPKPKPEPKPKGGTKRPKGDPKPKETAKKPKTGKDGEELIGSDSDSASVKD